MNENKTPTTEVEQLKSQIDQIMQAYLQRGQQLAALQADKAQLEQNIYIVQKELERVNKELDSFRKAKSDD